MKIEEPAISVAPQYSSPRGEFKSTVFIGRTRAVMYQLFDKHLRKATLQQMGEIYNIQFDSAEIEKFSKIDVVCVPIASLKKYLAAYNDKQPFFNQPGIPVTPGNNELADWILESRKVSRALQGHDLNVAIDADKTLLYPDIENIFNTLRKQNIFFFRLIASINPSNDNSKDSESDSMKRSDYSRVIY
ncbi:hypothetical protein [Mucilaginibacter sp.]|uniref:hypothetical protein n=1 Tax=Mucilaginibacter sp. TaxID=1882438 RepID=UPI00344B7FB9